MPFPALLAPAYRAVAVVIAVCEQPRSWLMAVVLLAASTVALSADVVLPAASFARAHLVDAAAADRIRSSGSLGGGEGAWGINGHVEYDFSVSESGWYEILLEGTGNEVGFVVDRATPATTFFGAATEGSKPPKIGNVWLAKGVHTLRAEKYFWTGFPQLRGFIVRRSDDSIATSARLIHGDSSGGPYRLGACPEARLLIGNGRLGDLSVEMRNLTQPSSTVGTLQAGAGGAFREITFRLKCDEPGRYQAFLRVAGSAVSWRDVRPLEYEVIDTRRTGRIVHSERSQLVDEIDLTATPPDYAGGDTQVVNSRAGRYRQSGNTGFTRFQRTTESARRLLPQPNWFAYRLSGLTPQQPYLLEVDYPDDATRMMVIAIRENVGKLLDPAGGVDSGAEFRLSRRMLTHSLLFWPKTAEPRVLFMTAHSGYRAAAARLRVYRLDEAPIAVHAQAGKRLVLNWYEEGMSLAGIYGTNVVSVPAFNAALDRWTRSAAFAGANVLAPTPVIYESAHYPSRFNRMFSRPDVDYLRTLILHAEAAGLKVLPDLHPRADELTWPFATAADPKPNLLVSKDGRTSYYAGDGRTRNYPPFYNPLHPSNQDWYIGMLGELTERYADSPALIGVNLRLLQWKNPTLNNFHSLDWGYDDLTVGMFERETGIALPVPRESTPATIGDNARARHQWLMHNAKAQWIDWRCRKIAQLYTRARDRLRQARPDLKLFTSVFAWGAGNDADALREAGIDVALLARIDGVVVVNALPRYGRREPEPLAQQHMRDNLVDVRRLNMLRPAGVPGAFLFSSNYVEATPVVAPPPALGLSSGGGSWLSASVHPAGRHALEGYALQLAETDAQVIGDGGNGYALGQPLIRAWLREYAALPAEPFMAREDAADPVAVWTRVRSDGLWFYAVNRERFSVGVSLKLGGAREVERPVGGRREAVDGAGQLRFTLQPYELRTYRADAGATLIGVSTTVPAAERTRMQVMLDWLAQREGDARALGSGERALLAEARREAAAALAQGHIWHARMRLERQELIAVYERTNAYPPGLRDGR